MQDPTDLTKDELLILNIIQYYEYIGHSPTKEELENAFNMIRSII